MIAQRQVDGRPEVNVPGTSYAVVPVAAIYGANASGKSNMIAAMAWMRRAILDSYRKWDPDGGVPRIPFAFREDHAKFPSSFELDFVLDGIRHSYGFEVDDEQVLREWLEFFPEGRPRKLFERVGADVSFGRSMTGQRKSIADQLRLRTNSLLVSAGAQSGHGQLQAIREFFATMINSADDRDYAQRLHRTVAMFEASDETKRAAVRSLLSHADLGIVGLRAYEPDANQIAESARLVAMIREAFGREVRIEHSHSKRVQVVHTTDTGTFELALERESSGTRTWIGLIGPVVAALESGGVLIVDELDARLHPLLVDALIGLFTHRQVNCLGAQLIFSTHDVTLMGRYAKSHLARDQIWFADKNANSLATSVFPLTEFKPRMDENHEIGYLLGRYGATPFFADDQLGMSGVFNTTRGRGAAEPGTRPEFAEGSERKPETADLH
ncbi:AAA family ATPase [Nocardia camponoti]|nr:ATP-binding protein [Nocardia camponoti]